MKEKGYYSVAEFAEEYPSSESQTRAWIRKGILRAERITGTRKYRIPRSELERLKKPEAEPSHTAATESVAALNLEHRNLVGKTAVALRESLSSLIPRPRDLIAEDGSLLGIDQWISSLKGDRIEFDALTQHMGDPYSSRVNSLFMQLREFSRAAKQTHSWIQEKWTSLGVEPYHYTSPDAGVMLYRVSADTACVANASYQETWETGVSEFPYSWWYPLSAKIGKQSLMWVGQELTLVGDGEGKVWEGNGRIQLGPNTIASVRNYAQAKSAMSKIQKLITSVSIDSRLQRLSSSYFTTLRIAEEVREQLAPSAVLKGTIDKRCEWCPSASA